MALSLTMVLVEGEIKNRLTYGVALLIVDVKNIWKLQFLGYVIKMYNGKVTKKLFDRRRKFGRLVIGRCSKEYKSYECQEMDSEGK